MESGFNDLIRCFKDIKKVKNKPSVILANTIKGKGVKFMEDKVEWHYKSPNDKELKVAIKQIQNA